MSRTHFDAKQKIWSGSKKNLASGPEVSLGRSLLQGLLKHPDHVAQINDSNGHQYTNQEIATLSIRVAQHLYELGIQQEDVVSFCGTNTDFVAPLVIGTLFCGASVNPLCISFHKENFRYMLSVTKPKILFCDGKLYDTIHPCLTEVNLNIPVYTMRDHRPGVRRIDELIASTGKENAYKVQPLNLGSSQTAFILSTSGTTGSLKVIGISHESVMHSTVFDTDGSSHDEIYFCFSNLYWISGIVFLLEGTINGYKRIIIDETYSTERFLKMFEQQKISYVSGAPFHLTAAIKSAEFKKTDLTSLKYFNCVGNIVPLAIVQSFVERAKNCKVVAMYGMSELIAGVASGAPKKEFDSGQLRFNFRVKIIDESGKRVGVLQRGEVVIKSPFKWVGYYDNPEANKIIYNADGWIQSDDIGYFDDEGSLFILGRKKDVLTFKDVQVILPEIEVVIIQIPDVLEVCVVGIHDAFVAAAVIKKSNSYLSEYEVTKYVADRLADSKHITGGVYFFDSLPKTHSGKHIRRKVKEMLEKLWDQRTKVNRIGK